MQPTQRLVAEVDGAPSVAGLTAALVEFGRPRVPCHNSFCSAALNATRSTVSAVPNAEQSEYWDGSGGEHWVAEQARYDRMSGGFGDRLVEVLSPCPGDRVLDVGCGNGALSLAIGPLVAPDGWVLGLDLSGPMLKTATARAHSAGLMNVGFERGDAQVYPLAEAGFDGIVSRFRGDVLRRPAGSVRQPGPRPAVGRPDGLLLLAGAAGETSG